MFRKWIKSKPTKKIWIDPLKKFIKVSPKEYKKILKELEKY